MKTIEIKLSTPIKIDQKQVKSIHLRRPNVGELMGINMLDLIQIQTDAVLIVLPKITTPHLNRDQIIALDVVDFARMGAALVSFLGPSANVQNELKN